MRLIRYLTGLILALLLLCCSAWAQECIDLRHSFDDYAQTVAALGSRQTYAEGRDAVQAVLCRTEGVRLEDAALDALCLVAGPKNCYTLYYESAAKAQKDVEALRAMDGVRYAELDADVQAAAAPSFMSWGARVMGTAPYLTFAAQYGQGSSVVAVIDSGVSRHPALTARLTRSGYDYVDLDSDATNDLYGHGTAVAGIIADCTQGAQVSIYPVRVLNASGGGKISNVANAVHEAVLWGVDVINLSIESKIMSQALDDAIADAVGSGVTVVVAAGNSGINTSLVCPAHITSRGVIVVGAAEYGEGSCIRSSYSNYGDSVDLYAFGSAITACSKSGGYASVTGTSFAAPHVSALSALMHLAYPGLSPSQTENRIRQAAQYTGVVNVPDMKRLVPADYGMLVYQLPLQTGESIVLPALALPADCGEAITYLSDQPQVVCVEEGRLTALSAGEATVTASCFGLTDMAFTVTVTDAPLPALCLPSGITELGTEALRGMENAVRVVLPEGLQTLGAAVLEDCPALTVVEAPASLTKIGENTFSGALVICPPESAMLTWIKQRGLPYLVRMQENADVSQ